MVTVSKLMSDSHMERKRLCVSVCRYGHACVCRLGQSAGASRTGTGPSVSADWAEVEQLSA